MPNAKHFPQEMPRLTISQGLAHPFTRSSSLPISMVCSQCMKFYTPLFHNIDLILPDSCVFHADHLMTVKSHAILLLSHSVLSPLHCKLFTINDFSVILRFTQFPLRCSARKITFSISKLHQLIHLKKSLNIIKTKNVLQDHLPQNPYNFSSLPVPPLPSHSWYKHFYYI